MTGKEIIDNIFKGFTTKDEGFSVKKQLAAVVVVTMLIATFKYADSQNWFIVLGAWLSFALALLGIGAIEKNIAAVNETKQAIGTKQ